MLVKMAAAGGRGRSNYGGGTEGGRVLKWLKRDKAGDQYEGGCGGGSGRWGRQGEQRCPA